MTIISMIVDRCHVADSYPQVLRYVISRMKRGKKQWREATREQRREVVRELVDTHKANRELYRMVMG
jgi:hypothetical protein